MKPFTWGVLAGMVGILSTSPARAGQEKGPYGAWDLTLHTDSGPRPSWVKMFKEDGVLVADFVGTGGGKNRAKDVKVQDNRCQWTIGNATYHAHVADGKLKGHLVRDGSRIQFTGQRSLRRPDVTGTWDVQVDIGDRTLERVLNLEQQDGRITGTYGGGQFEQRPITKAKLDGQRLTFGFQFETGDAQRFDLAYELKVEGDRLAGTSSVVERGWKAQVSGTRRRSWGEPIKLFNGKDLSNWDFQRVRDANHWKVVDGVMVNERAGWNILTSRKFKDYKLRVDVKVPPKGNSGIYLNGRYEVQVADSHGSVGKGTMGAIYGRAVPSVDAARPANEWQTFEIRFVDFWATIKLNGTTIIDNVLIEGITGGALDSHESEPGPIMFQGDHGPIQYRNVVLTPLLR